MAGGWTQPLVAPPGWGSELGLGTSSPFPKQTHPLHGMTEGEEDSEFQKNNNELVKTECSW